MRRQRYRVQVNVCVTLVGLACLALTAGFRTDRSQAGSVRWLGWLLIAFLALGRSVQFVPVQVIYKSQPSKIHPIVDSWRWWKWWTNAKGR